MGRISILCGGWLKTRAQDTEVLGPISTLRKLSFLGVPSNLRNFVTGLDSGHILSFLIAFSCNISLIFSCLVIH